MAFQKGHKKVGGRPKGSTTKPRFSDYITEKDVRKLVSSALILAKGGNDIMLKFCLEQHFGKAIQPMEGDFKGEIKLVFDESFKTKI